MSPKPELFSQVKALESRAARTEGLISQLQATRALISDVESVSFLLNAEINSLVDRIVTLEGAAWLTEESGDARYSRYFEGDGNPNTNILIAAQGSVYLDKTNTVYYVNTDGGATWLDLSTHLTLDVTTTGDIQIWGASAGDRLAVGGDGYVPVADSNESQGLVYQPGPMIAYLSLIRSFPHRGIWGGGVDSSGDWLDLSAQGRTLTKTGSQKMGMGTSGPYPKWGLSGSSQYFSRATESGLEIAGTESYIEDPGITIVTWVESNNASGLYALVSKWGSSPNLSFLLYQNTGSYTFSISDDGSSTQNISSATVSTSPQLVIARLTPSVSLDLIINNVKSSLEVSVKASININAASLFVGAISTGGWYYNGDQSIVSIHPCALSDDECTEIWKTGKYLYGAT